MSEETKSLVQQRLEKVENFLNSYEQKIGMGNMRESDVGKYLNMTSEILRGMTAEQCGEAAYLLNQEALYVQHEINKWQAQLEWAKAAIDKTIASDVHNHGNKYLPFELKRVIAIKSDNYTQELQDIVSKNERIITRLSYVPGHLKNLASTLLDYQKTKMRSNQT